MTDHATPNLPSPDFEATSQFYGSLGFTESWCDDGWMILRRGELMLEFFPYEGLDSYSNNFSCCLRLDDLDSFYRACTDAGVPEARTGIPRLVAPRMEESGLRIAYMVDPHGTLVRLIQNP